MSEHTITITLDEALSLAETSMAVEPFRTPEQNQRFESHSDGIDIELIFSDPKFDNGTLHWVPTHLEAIVLAKVLRAEDHQAHVLWDMAENPPGTPSGWVILTSRAPGF